MADSRHFENRKIAISQQWVRCTLSADKISNSQNPKWRTAAILKIAIDCHILGTMTHI